jgi:hypothetical protein
MLLGAAERGRLLFLQRGLWGGTGGYQNSPLWFGTAQAPAMDLLCNGLLVCLDIMRRVCMHACQQQGMTKAQSCRA